MDQECGFGGAWLAQLVEHATLDLGFVSLVPRPPPRWVQRLLKNNILKKCGV